MPELIKRLLRFLDTNAYSYNVDSENEIIHFEIVCDQTIIDLTLSSIEGLGVIFEATLIESFKVVDDKQLFTLGQLCCVGLIHNPHSGDVRLRKWIPAGIRGLPTETVKATLEQLKLFIPQIKHALTLMQNGVGVRDALANANKIFPQKSKANEIMLNLHANAFVEKSRLQNLLYEFDNLQGQKDQKSQQHLKDLCDEVLDYVQSWDTPDTWAAVQQVLGMACQTLYEISGKAHHAEIAINAFRSALIVSGKQSNNWAFIQENIANLHINQFKVTGALQYAKAAENVFLSLSKVYAQEGDSDRWAQTMDSLGNLNARRHKITGNLKYIEAAEECYKKALEVYTQSENPLKWAITQSNIAIIYAIQFRQSDDLNQGLAAETAFRAALTTITRDREPKYWADIMANFGSLCFDLLIKTNDSRYVAEGISALRSALTVIIREKGPHRWAEIQHKLGELYLSKYIRTCDFRFIKLTENALLSALAVIKPEISPWFWAAIQFDMASLYHRQFEATGLLKHAEVADKAYKSALRIYSLERNRFEWTRTNCSLAALHADLYKKTGDLGYAKTSEDAYQKVLKSYLKSKDLIQWANILSLLGELYLNLHLSTGQVKHFAAAEEMYGSLFENCTMESNPQEWANAHLAIGILNVYQYQGTNNLGKAEAASEAFNEALRVYKYEGSHNEWALIKMFLGHINYQKFENTENSIYGEASKSCYLNALKIFTLDENPEEWRKMQFNMSMILIKQFENTCDLKIAKEAEKALFSAQDFCAFETSPNDWARVQINLAYLYNLLYIITGETKYAKLAKEANYVVLKTFTRDSNPKYWAITQQRLGGLHTTTYIMTGNEEYFSAAKKSFHAALRVFKRKDQSDLWGTIQRSLGTLHRAKYELTGNVGQAAVSEKFYLNAIDAQDCNTNKFDWANTYYNLSSLYLKQLEITGRLIYSKAVEDSCQMLLTVFDQDKDSVQWASTNQNLGNLHFYLYERTGKPEHARAAIEAYRLSLTVFSRNIYAINWATTQQNIGNLYLHQYKRTADLSHADASKKAYLYALSVYSRDKHPKKWADIKLNIASLYIEQYKQTSDLQSAERAAEACQKVKMIYSKLKYLANNATLQINIGGLYALQYKKTGDLNEFKKAEKAYVKALKIMANHSTYGLIYKIALVLGNLYIRRNQWRDAHSVFEMALQNAYNHYLDMKSNIDKRQLMNDHEFLYRLDACSFLKMGKLPEAWDRLEQGNARSLANVMGFETLARKNHGKQAVQRMREARQVWLQADRQLHTLKERIDSGYRSNVQYNIAKSLKKKQEAVDKAFSDFNIFLSKLGIEYRSPNIDKIINIRLPPNTAAVSLLLDDHVSHAIIYYNQEVKSVPLPNFTLKTLRKIIAELPIKVKEWIDSYEELLNASAILEEAEKIGGEKIFEAKKKLSEKEKKWDAMLSQIARVKGEYQAGWVITYGLAFEAMRDTKHAEANRSAMTAWKSSLVNILKTLSKDFWAPIVSLFPNDVFKVILIPSGFTPLLPIHSAAPGNLKVAYAPSLNVWKNCQVRAEENIRKPYDLFLATPASDLFFSNAECELISKRIQEAGQKVEHLKYSDATVSSVSKMAKEHGIVHFSGHAIYDWESPLSSCLLCYDGRLTISEIIEIIDLSSSRVVTLSACSTAISDVFNFRNEFVGLPSALLETGAPAVLASLWPVNEISTAFLMDRFYELWIGDNRKSISEALWESSQWLRKATSHELLHRIDQSSLTLTSREMLKNTLEKFLNKETSHNADTLCNLSTSESLKENNHRPFSDPYYWAPFVAYGAVV